MAITGAIGFGGFIYVGGGTVPGGIGAITYGGTDPFSEDEMGKRLTVAVPAESGIEETRGASQKRFHTMELLCIPNDVLQLILGKLFPCELKIAARTCTTLYVNAKQPGALRSSLLKILPNVHLLSNSTLTYDQQFRVICGRLFGEIKIINEEGKKPLLADVRLLRGPNGFDGVIDASWKCHQRACELSGRAPLSKADLLAGPDLSAYNHLCVLLLNNYLSADSRLTFLVGPNYNGEEASIDPNSKIGTLNAKIAAVIVRFNNPDKIDFLIRTTEQSNIDFND